jgi:hypothetical protein
MRQNGFTIDKLLLTLDGSFEPENLGPAESAMQAVTQAAPSFSNLKASQSIGYGTSSLTLNGTLSASGPVYPAMGETVTVTIDGKAQNTTVSDSTGDFSINYNPSSIPVTGSPFAIAYSYAGDTGLSGATNASTTLTVTQVNLTVTANSLSKSQGLANPALTVGYSGFVNGETAASLTTAPVLTTTATKSSGPGGYPITFSVNAADANYNINEVTGTLTVVATPQVSGLSLKGTQFVFSYPTLVGQSYQLQSKTNLNAGTWSSVGGPVAGTGAAIMATNNVSASSQFFRLTISN